ncbi:MAG: hypothetical protein ACSLFR_07015 [Solirubrobacteraceae bacterium]
MKERLVSWFPYIIAIVLPLAGLFLALWRFTEHDRVQGMYLVLISLTAGLVWWIALSGM